MATVSQRDIYNAIKDLRTEILTELRDVRGDVEELKDFRSRFYGVMGVFTAFFSLAATFVWNKIFGINK